MSPSLVLDDREYPRITTFLRTKQRAPFRRAQTAPRTSPRLFDQPPRRVSIGGVTRAHTRPAHTTSPLDRRTDGCAVVTAGVVVVVVVVAADVVDVRSYVNLTSVNMHSRRPRREAPRRLRRAVSTVTAPLPPAAAPPPRYHRTTTAAAHITDRRRYYGGTPDTRILTRCPVVPPSVTLFSLRGGQRTRVREDLPDRVPTAPSFSLSLHPFARRVYDLRFYLSVTRARARIPLRSREKTSKLATATPATLVEMRDCKTPGSET